jgi:hypothetical protein
MLSDNLSKAHQRQGRSIESTLRVETIEAIIEAILVFGDWIVVAIHPGIGQTMMRV